MARGGSKEGTTDMAAGVLARMTGEELLLFSVLAGDSARPPVDAELQRRSLLGAPLPGANAHAGKSNRRRATTTGGKETVAA